MNSEPNQQISVSDLAWAKSALDDVLFGCILNIQLTQAGICSKYIFEMTDSEMAEYVKILDEIYESRNA